MLHVEMYRFSATRFFVFFICRVAVCVLSFPVAFTSVAVFFSVALLFAVAVFAVNHAEGCPMLAVLLRTHCSAGNIVRLMA